MSAATPNDRRVPDGPCGVCIKVLRPGVPCVWTRTHGWVCADHADPFRTITITVSGSGAIAPHRHFARETKG